MGSGGSCHRRNESGCLKSNLSWMFAVSLWKLDSVELLELSCWNRGGSCHHRYDMGGPIQSVLDIRSFPEETGGRSCWSSSGGTVEVPVIAGMMWPDPSEHELGDRSFSMETGEWSYWSSIAEPRRFLSSGR